MKISFKAALAIGAFSLGAGSAFADNVTPTNLPIPLPGAPGGVMLSVWNSSLSVTEYLNLKITDIQLPSMTPSGGRLIDFGNIDLSSFGSSPTGLQYSVLSGDFRGPDPRTWQVAFTAPQNQATVTGANGDSIQNSLANMGQLFNNQNIACGTSAQCVATSGQGWYAAANNWATTLGNNLPFSAAGAVGSALSFWLLTSTSEFGFDDATLTQYKNGSGIGEWLLANVAGTNNYHLTYQIPGGSTVPLPAAAWLLLSGLAGLGVVGRRRSVVVA